MVSSAFDGRPMAAIPATVGQELGQRQGGLCEDASHRTLADLTFLGNDGLGRTPLGHVADLQAGHDVDHRPGLLVEPADDRRPGPDHLRGDPARLSGWLPAKLSGFHKRRPYPVPWRFIGKRVWVRAKNCTLEVWADDERIITHERGVPVPDARPVPARPTQQPPPSQPGLLAETCRRSEPASRRIHSGSLCERRRALHAAHRHLHAHPTRKAPH